MARFDTRMHRAPVAIARSSARIQQRQMLTDVERLALGAGNYGQREARFASVPVRLRIQRDAGANSPIALAGAKPLGYTRRKRGFPPITSTGAGG